MNKYKKVRIREYEKSMFDNYLKTSKFYLESF